MKSLILLGISICLFLFALAPVKADLPIHCLHAQIAGEWTFSRDVGGHRPKGHDLTSVTCGYPQPDRNVDHFIRPAEMITSKKVKITLKEPNIAIDSDGNRGVWTMVYDEGFEVRVGGFVYFAFSKYTPKSGTSLSSDKVAHYISHCDQTLVGWYRSDDNKFYGCWKGQQDQAANSWTKPTYSTKDDGKEVVPIVSPTSLSLIEDFHNVNAERHDPVKHGNYRPMQVVEDGANSFVEVNNAVSMPEIDENALFEPNYEFIETINNDASVTWKAGMHDQFKNKPVHEMMRMLGLKRFRKGSDAAALPQPIHDPRPDSEKYAGLPTNWDWSDIDGTNYDTEIRNQGSCGSCYAMATISALESRFRVASRLSLRPLLSPQEIVSCSFYNQGCEGGYPFLVGKHGAEFGLADAECVPYQARNSQCPGKCRHERYHVANYSYVGGFYGGCNEAAMMKEIYEKGPVMVAFQAPPDLFYYTGGIYTGPAPKFEPQGVAGVNVWQQTNHAVVAVGWGVDRATGTKYWKLKNTWGAKWGEAGYFRIRRGTNECGVESMATKADAILPHGHKVPRKAHNPWPRFISKDE